METKLVCPVCKRPLFKYEKMFKCEDNHTYDIAKEGYVNLMLANNKNSKEPGDNKEMMIARRDFLNAGFYQKLLNEIISVLKMHVLEDSTIIEAGCGEGYYISNIKNVFHKSEVYGFDISKDAIKYAAKRNNNINVYVSSSYSSNIKSRSVDALLIVFAPFAEKEFNRILSDNGIIVLVKPRTEHLLELKKTFYSDIKPTTEKEYENFYVYKTINVAYNIFPDCKNLENLFKMTPFYYQVGEKNRQKLDFSMGKNGIKVDFLIEVLKKIKN